MRFRSLIQWVAVQIRDRVENGILILSPLGRMDHAGSEAFHEAVGQWIAKEHRAILVDFQEVTFLSSMGIRALVGTSQELTRCGGRLALTGLSGALDTLFDTAGIRSLFPIFASTGEALQSDIWPRAA